MNESKVRPIYERALALPPEEREAFVRETCGADAALCDRVLALLQANDEKGDYLARPTGAPPRAAVVPARVDSAAVERQGTVIGRYCLLQQIGEGGMGTVWMAEQREPVRRKVALKIIKLGMDSKQVSARFEAERQALALMDHPSIAKVLDGGTTDTGRPYFVMELVKGVPLTTFCDEAQLDIRARLTLFAEVCQAVQHAHQKGIIHRDIKPSNVLVTLHDGRPVPKVIDFGIAKATNQELTQKTLFTEYAQILGTPEYMAPEQASLSGLDVDTRSDVYSLGVLLYELLTGTRPFDFKTLLASGYEELLRTIREVDPPKPSTRASTTDAATERAIGVARQMQLGQLHRTLRGDLDWIIVKAMEKDRARRYESPSDLAADIRRYLVDEPVMATPPSAIYRMRKFVRRYKFQFAAATIVLLTLIAGIIGTTWFALEAQTRATEAEHARDVAHAEATRADRERDIAEWNGYFGLLQAAAVAAENREYDRARRLLARCPEEHRGFEWRHRSQSLETALFTLEGHEGDVRRISFSPDGHKLVSSSYDHTARIWDLRTGALLSTLRGHTWDVSDARFSPDGRRIATSSGDKTVRIWDASSGECLHVLEGHEDYLASVMYSPDGTLLLSFSQQEKTFRTWDAGTGTAVRVFEGHEENLFSVEFSEDGSQVISAGLDKTIRIWDVATGELLRTLVDPEFAIHSARSFAHGTRILSVPFRGSTVRVWDATSGELLHSLECHGLAHPRPILYADETRVFISAWGAESFAWDISGPTALRLEGLPGGIHEASISRDGRHALSEGRIWEPGTGVILRTLPTKGPGIFSPDGSIIATRSGSKIRIWDTRTDGLRHALPYHRGDVVAAQFSRASDRIVTMDWGPGENVVRVWDTATGALRTTLRHVSRDGSEQGTEDFDPVPRTLTQVFGRDRFKQVTLSPNGSLLALATAQGALVVWQVITEHRLWARPPETGVRCARFDSDGERLLTGHADGTVRVWQAKDGELSRTFGGHTGSINSVAWSSDDLRIVTTSEDATVRIWDTTTGTCLHVLEGHRTVTSTRLSDDGRLLVSSSGDGGVATADRTVRIWDAHRGSLLHALQTQGPTVDRTSLSPDGRFVLTSSRVSLISELWDTQTGTRLETLVDQYAATFSHDGSRVLTCSIDGSLRIFDTTSGDLLETFGGIGSVESVAFSPDGHRIVCAGRDGNVWLFHDDVERARPYWESADVRRRAQPRVDALFAKLTRRSDVIRTLSQDAELDPALRATAIELAREHVEKVFGFTYGPPDEETAKQLGLTATEALVVRSVERGSTAEVGGLRPNDVILRVDDQPASQDALRDAKAERAVGAIVAFTIRRNGETQTLSVRIGAQ